MDREDDDAAIGSRTELMQLDLLGGFETYSSMPRRSNAWAREAARALEYS
jgi:hypothetical protein